MSERFNTEVLIVGTGISGLIAAIKLSERYSVTILSKSSLSDCSTAWAQGGIAAVIDNEDNINNHIKDTINNGHEICNTNSVQQIIKQGKDSIELLLNYGVNFNKKGKGLDQTLEGGHSHRRIVYHNDNTGEEVHSSLLREARKRKNIIIKENIMVIDMIGKKENYCEGVYAYDKRNNNVVSIKANIIILATGGASKIYQYTTNPNTSTGDGIAMAWRFGCEISNMEFIQFHPTCLFHPKEKSFLISESLRGEGAKLKDLNGNCFMKKYDERLELAPRDIVARAIDAEMKNNNLDHVNLDISFKDKEFILRRFPNIYQRCLELDIDITKEAIPVVPAAHYTCGGVKVDLDSKTNIENLYAIGEVSSTGLHGANRMASNSLLECVVFAKKASDHIYKNFKNHDEVIQEWDISKVTETQEGVIIRHNWDDIRRLMWDYVGIVRSNNLLKRAEIAMKVIDEEVNYFYGKYLISSDLIELRNLALVANLIIKSAQKRKESRGLHYSLDYPNLLKTASPTILDPSKITI